MLLYSHHCSIFDATTKYRRPSITHHYNGLSIGKNPYFIANLQKLSMKIDVQEKGAEIKCFINTNANWKQNEIAFQYANTENHRFSFGPSPGTGWGKFKVLFFWTTPAGSDFDRLKTSVGRNPGLRCGQNETAAGHNSRYKDEVWRNFIIYNTVYYSRCNCGARKSILE